MLRANKLITAGVIGSVILLTAPTAWGLDFRAGKLALLEICMLISACFLLKMPLRLCCLWAVALLVLRYNPESAIGCWRVLMAALAIQFLGRIDPKDLFAGLRIAVIINTAYMLFQSVGIDPLLYTMQGQNPNAVTGFVDNSVFAGCLTGITLPLFAKGRWRFWLIPSFIAVAATGSSAGAVASIVTGLIILPKKLIPLCLIFAVCYASFVEPLGNKMIQERGNRIPVWQETIRLASKNILTGSGIGSYSIRIKRESNLHPEFRWSHAQNEPLQLWFEQGLIGVGIWLYAIGFWILRGLRMQDKTAAHIGLGWLAASMFTITAYTPAPALVGIICIGAIRDA